MRASHGLILASLSLLAVGVVMVTSAGLSVGGGELRGFADIARSRPAWFAALAVTLLALGSRLPVRRLAALEGLSSPLPWIAMASIALLLAVHVPGLGHEVNGARRWISLGPVGFQPSELVKWGLLFIIAGHAARHAASLDRLGRGFIAPMLLVGLVGVLIGAEDLGTAVLIVLVAVVLLLAGGARLSHAALLVPVGAIAFAAAVVVSPYRLGRLRAFLNPYQDPQGIGYHVLQSMGAVAGGGLAGRGLGNGIQKFGYLPEDTTDFIFAIIAEELGLAGVLLVICLYATLLLCGLSIVARAEQQFARLLGLGIVMTIGFQTLMNLMVVTGLAPTKGIALPLVSSGGTGWCLTAFCVGVLVSIEREARREAAREAITDRPRLVAFAGARFRRS